jgi:protein gp37
MAGKSAIEWTENSWNPATGCEQVSPGCDRCYAMRLVNVRQVNNPRSPRYGHPFNEVLLHENRLDQPSRWRGPKRIFVNSMSDLFHRNISDEFIDRVFDEMERNARHKFQVLTKRAERMKRYVNKRYKKTPCPANIWLGVSIENADYAWRAKMLRQTNAIVRWISAEPLLGSLVDLDLDGIAWLVAGGESGSGARRMDPSWVRQLRDKCRALEVAFFFKQWGGVTKKGGGEKAVLDGRRWMEYPVTEDAA